MAPAQRRLHAVYRLDAIALICSFFFSLFAVFRLLAVFARPRRRPQRRRRTVDHVAQRAAPHPLLNIVERSSGGVEISTIVAANPADRGNVSVAQHGQGGHFTDQRLRVGVRGRVRVAKMRCRVAVTATAMRHVGESTVGPRYMRPVTTQRPFNIYMKQKNCCSISGCRDTALSCHQRHHE